MNNGKFRTKKIRYVNFFAYLILAIIIIALLFLCFNGDGVTLSDFEANEVYFVAGEENNITFTVSAIGEPDSITLYLKDEPVAEMFDTGQEGDDTAGDGVYTAILTFEEEETVQLEYSCGVDDVILSDTLIIYIFAKPTDENFEEVEQVIEDIEEIESKYSDEAGYVPADSKEDVMTEVTTYIEALYANEILIYYEVNNDNIFFKFASGLSIVYEPDTGETDAGGNGVAMTLVTCQPCLSIYSSNLSSYMTLPDEAAQIIEDTFSNYTYSDAKNYDNEDVTLEMIKSFEANQVVLWHGHGGYSSSLHSYLLTGDDYSNWYESYWDDYAKDTIIASSSGKACITSKFIDKYCKDLNNSLFYLAACCSGEDSVLADSFLNKGAAAVVGNSDSVLTKYNLLIQYTTMEYMTQINSETGNYYTLSEALTMAKEDYGKTDADYSSSGVGAYAIIFGGTEAEEYLLGEIIELTDYYGNLSTFIDIANLSEKENGYSYFSDYMEVNVINPDTMDEFIVTNMDEAYCAYGIKIGDNEEAALASIEEYGLVIESYSSVSNYSEIYLWDEKGAFDVVCVSLTYDQSGNVERWSVCNWPEGDIESYYIALLEEAHQQGITKFADWQTAYIQFLEEDYFVDNYEANMYACSLLYIDDDEIPELYIEYGSTAGGSKLVYFDGEEIITQQLYTLGLSYIERENLFLDSGGHMDEYYDTVYTIQDDEFTVVASGTYGSKDNSNVQYDSDGEPIYEYYWNEKKTTKTNYISNLDNTFDTDLAIKPFGDYNSETGIYEESYGIWEICSNIISFS